MVLHCYRVYCRFWDSRASGAEDLLESGEAGDADLEDCSELFVEEGRDELLCGGGGVEEGGKVNVQSYSASKGHFGNGGK